MITPTQPELPFEGFEEIPLSWDREVPLDVKSLSWQGLVSYFDEKMDGRL